MAQRVRLGGVEYDLRPFPPPAASQCADTDLIGVLMRPTATEGTCRASPDLQPLPRMLFPHEHLWRLSWVEGYVVLDEPVVHPAFLGWFWLTDPLPLVWEESPPSTDCPTWKSGDLVITEYVLHVGGSEYEACWSFGDRRFDSHDAAKLAAATWARDIRTGVAQAEEDEHASDG